MNRRGLRAAAIGVPAALVLVAASTSGKTPLFERYPEISLGRGGGEGPESSLFEFETRDEETDVFKIWEVDLPEFLDVVLQVLLVAATIALVISLWNRRPRLRWRNRRTSEEFEVLDDLASLVVADAAAQRSLLAAGEPRNAIVACWLRLEALTFDAGFERDPADTSEEFTSRVLNEFSVDSSAVGELAALYRKARFSSHEIGENERADALAALDVVHSGLRRGEVTVS